MTRTLALSEILSLLSAIFAALRFLAYISSLLELFEYGAELDIRWVFWGLGELTVLLVAISVYFATKTTREQLTALLSSLRTSAEAVIKTEVIAAGISIEEELKRYEEYLAKLEELKRLGQVSEEAYQALKGEYMAKIEELRKKIQAG